MEFSKALAHNFSKKTLDRGEEYFRGRHVEFAGVDPDCDVLVYDVEGSLPYRVGITFDPQDLTWVAADCTCPYDEGWCKHLWAVIRKVEADFDLPEVSGRVYLDLLEDTLYEDEFRSGPARGLGGQESALMRFVDTKGKLRPPSWMGLLNRVSRELSSHQGSAAPAVTGGPLEPWYVLQDPREHRNQFVLMLMHQTVTASGRLGKPKPLSLTPADVPRLTTDLDRHIALMIMGAGEHYYGYMGSGYYGRGYEARSKQWILSEASREPLLRMMAQTHRLCSWHMINGRPAPLQLDDGPAWEFSLELEAAGEPDQARLTARLRRGDESRPLKDVAGFVRGRSGLIVMGGKLAKAEWYESFDWIVPLREAGEVIINRDEHLELAKGLSALKAYPPIRWPEEWEIREVGDIPPQPQLTLAPDRYTARNLSAVLRLSYDGIAIPPGHRGAILVDTEGKRQIRRDVERERDLLRELPPLGFEVDPYSHDYRLPAKRMPEAVRVLVSKGWSVVAEQKLIRAAGDFKIEVTSGIDWFDLSGTVAFGDQSVTIPKILQTLRKGQTFVTLGDGSLGVLPEEWLARHASLLEMGTVTKDQVRFKRTQLGLVDALLAQVPEARFDETLAAARRRLAEFEGVRPLSPPAGFVGELRHYQQEGLGWLEFLNEFGWGGCLADDMGLGKTVQVLALLLARRRKQIGKPSLVVVPKSLVFNWKREAERFAPELTVLDYTGTGRKAVRDEITRAHVVLTTYGTLRRDVELLKDQEFDYAILDEAQAIKNGDSLNAKCSRLMNADHRLVMTGTPVENHLGDLWSLFEFLNPGMLGAASAFKTTFASGDRTNGSNGSNGSRLGTLQRMLRPFILRRTKQLVAPELPDRSEQTIECVMPPKQAAMYAELREFYRKSLLGRVETEGMAKSKVYVLEALLRLRQAACHPGLVDKNRGRDESAKLESLIPMLGEIIDGGHKALIFSQFTTFLDILRARLAGEKYRYEYLDGKTAHREKCVERFQSDPSCPLFLISLKAGGTGLNLTAADYVFILDPWWNPAVEAQAIDRTHRIGQDKSVIAYRLIARDTVEDKILQLQQSKRDLADAIITESNSLIRDLTREDLDVLLS